ncbi:MerC domain-containing protein [Winogradskyella sp.]|uniref:MerC domain-containing protein n=1 Tax=Winogradskyella sp. TaxID=1883156 RepID=UPI0026316987|nr:MerC domain-containing protein [Winogradskyella sp.]
MITKSLKEKNSDFIGALSSGVCLIHCIVTPFIFLAQTSAATHGTNVPIWWSAIDVLFIIISFFAVYWSAKNSSKPLVVRALWISWVLLCAGILNEKFEILHLPEISIYIPAIALIILHLYNKKYCQCKDENCCASTS